MIEITDTGEVIYTLDTSSLSSSEVFKENVNLPAQEQSETALPMCFISFARPNLDLKVMSMEAATLCLQLKDYVELPKFPFVTSLLCSVMLLKEQSSELSELKIFLDELHKIYTNVDLNQFYIQTFFNRVPQTNIFTVAVAGRDLRASQLKQLLEIQSQIYRIPVARESDIFSNMVKAFLSSPS